MSCVPSVTLHGGKLLRRDIRMAETFHTSGIVLIPRVQKHDYTTCIHACSRNCVQKLPFVRSYMVRISLLGINQKFLCCPSQEQIHAFFELNSCDGIWLTFKGPSMIRTSLIKSTAGRPGSEGPAR